ncbi:undecaprenol kinase [Sinobaca qinghaiensis]|uniref:Undecaprenol kinase n=2 Tax=Sinobaca qinghaiensis TaxID=342944 RepID=A0A419V3P6_9BACL|nr:undecaprenol kinase [Sinobaca qinghaiensis]
MQYHLAAAAAVIVLALLVPFPLWKWVVLLLTIGMVLSLELLNTALEKTVDLVTEQYHPLAEKAKDAAAAGVFIFTITAVIIGILLFAEPVSVWL